MIYFNDLPETIIYQNEIAYQSKYYGYYATESGKCITLKVKGGQGSIDINNPREHNYKLDKDGYKELCLSEVENGIHKRYYRRMHRFVYETIVGEIPEGLTIDHDNMRRTYNHICNLNVMTIEENTRKEKEYGIPRYILYNGNNCIGLINRLTLEYILGFKLTDNIIYEGNYDTFIWKRITK